MSQRTTKARRAARRRHRRELILQMNEPSPLLPDPFGFHYDMEGRPIGLGTWALMMEGRDRYLASDHLPNGFWVSTIWLGLDHNFGGKGPPLIFETMVFREASAPGADFDCRRYATRREALEGHRELVAEWRRRPALEVVPGGNCQEE